MTWFIIAAIGGFLVYKWKLAPWAWARLLALRVRWDIVILAIAVFLAIGMIIPEIRWRFVQIAGFVGEGAVARLLLGILLGVLAAYAIPLAAASEAAPPPTPARAPAIPAKVPTKTAVAKAGGGAQLATEAEAKPKPDRIGIILTLAGAITLLALIAPHIDSWLARLAGFKTSIIEVQLSSISAASKAVKPDQREQFITVGLLEALSQYDESLERELALIQWFVIPDLEYQKERNPGAAQRLEARLTRAKNQRDLLGKLYGLFHGVISPTASCVKNALDNGLNIDSARRKLADLADQLTRIIILENEESDLTKKEQQPGNSGRAQRGFSAQHRTTTANIDTKYNELWTTLTSVPSTVSEFVVGDDKQKCTGIQLPGQSATEQPRHREFENVPSLHFARAALLLFVNNDRLAMQVLQDVRDKSADDERLKDINSFYLLAVLMFYQGDSVDKFLHILEDTRLLARERQDLIKRVNERCSEGCKQELKENQAKWTVELRNRAEAAEVQAMNLTAYATADDLAQGLQSAEPLQPIAEEFADWIKEKVSKPKQQSTDRVEPKHTPRHGRVRDNRERGAESQDFSAKRQQDQRNDSAARKGGR